MGLAGWVALALFAQVPAEDEAGTRGPDAWVMPGHRVHVYASEELNADSLGALARPGVVLWLETRSNALRTSTVQRLRRFGEAWIEVRPPYLEGQALSLRGAPAAGLWLRSAAHLGSPFARLGIRRVAVDVQGELTDPLLESLAKARAARVRWLPQEASLEGYARLLKAPGARALVWSEPSTSDGEASSCPPRGSGTAVTVVVNTAAEAARFSACGAAVRVRISPGIDPEALAALFRRVPTAELELRVDADERKAMAARRLLERLESAGRQ